MRAMGLMVLLVSACGSAGADRPTSVWAQQAASGECASIEECCAGVDPAEAEACAFDVREALGARQDTSPNDCNGQNGLRFDCRDVRDDAGSSDQPGF